MRSFGWTTGSTIGSSGNFFYSSGLFLPLQSPPIIIIFFIIKKKKIINENWIVKKFWTYLNILRFFGR